MFSTMEGYYRCKAVLAKNPNPMHKVFDWDKARQILSERGFPDADCGLEEDWGPTSGVLCADGKMIDPKECNAYLQSLWATPVIHIEDEVIECYKEEPFNKK